MAILEIGSIDRAFVQIDKEDENNKVLLMQIYDDWEWRDSDCKSDLKDEEHLRVLREKLNTYHKYIEDRQYQIDIPDQEFKSFEIEIFFINMTAKQLEKSLDFVYKELEETERKLNIKHSTLIILAHDEMLKEIGLKERGSKLVVEWDKKPPVLCQIYAKKCTLHEIERGFYGEFEIVLKLEKVYQGESNSDIDQDVYVSLTSRCLPSAVYTEQGKLICVNKEPTDKMTQFPEVTGRYKRNREKREQRKKQNNLFNWIHKLFAR